MNSSLCCTLTPKEIVTMEEIYANVEQMKPVVSRPSANQTGSRRCHRAVVPCLLLLSISLLAGLIGLGVHYHGSVRGLAEHLSTIKANLTGERDLLNASLAQVMKELHRLQSLSSQEKTCPTEWTMFRGSCYIISDKKGSWEKGREDCRGRGADLVVINSWEEQEFLSTFAEQNTWIGLSDRDKEGTWKWVDGSPLTEAYWWSNQPDNGNGDPQYGEEDCVKKITRQSEKSWNDISCDDSLFSTCEKKP